MTRQELKDEVEQFIDQTCLSVFLDLVEEICYEKGEHLVEVWGDKRAAKDWDKAAMLLEKVDVRLPDTLKRR